jgi:hypothetical protein
VVRAHRRRLERGRLALGRLGVSADLAPARRLGQVAPQDPDDRRSERADDEQPAPPLDEELLAGDEAPADERGERDAEEPERVRPGDVAPARVAWDELREVGVGECELRTEADPRAEAQGRQPAEIEAMTSALPFVERPYGSSSTAASTPPRKML